MLRKRICLCVLVSICWVLPIYSQQASIANVVPSVVKFNGTLSDADGKPLAGTQGVTFLLYKEQTGGAPLWLETQNVQADKSGRFSVMLGSASPHGLSPELFNDGEARWLAIHASGQAEQARTLLVSVPYALKAQDAETLGGKPASAFLAAPLSGAGAGQSGPQVEQKNEIVCSSSSACKTGSLPFFATNGGSSQVTDSIVTQSGTVINIAGSETVNSGIASGGIITATSAASSPTIVGTSIGTSGTSNGVQGVTSSATAAGVAGVNQTSTSTAIGVYGQSPAGYGVFGSGGIGVYGASSLDAPAVFGQNSSTTGGFADGVHGVATSPFASGVAGVNPGNGGVGVYGSAPNGDSFYADSNVQQALNAGGWVKAAAYVEAENNPPQIINCFNTTLVGSAATTPPCGLAVSGLNGQYFVDFGFLVDGHVLSATVGAGGPAFIETCTVSTCPVVPNNHTALVFTWNTGGGFSGVNYHLVVF